MSPIQLIKTLVILVVLGYLAVADSCEARNMGQQQQQEIAREPKQSGASNQLGDLDKILLDAAASNMDQIDTDNEDDVDEDEKTQIQNPLAAAGSNQQYQALPTNDLKTSASHHHHGHGAKGWLDMGAWTGKKGAFGWYDKHPVGGKKGK